MKLLITACAGISAFLFSFAFAAFVIWDADISTWLPVQRFVTAAMAVIFGGVSAATTWESIK